MADETTMQPGAAEEATTTVTEKTEQTEQTEQTGQGAEQASAAAVQETDAAQEAAQAEQEKADAGAANQAGQDEAQEPGQETQATDTEALKARVLDAELRAAAAVAGVPANRLAYVTRLADLSQAKDADPAEYAKSQIRQILSDFPELAHQPSGTGSAGNHQRAATSAENPEDQAIKAGFKQRF